MGVGSFLRLKGRTSFFRRKVPDALRARLARTEICATLGVVSRDSAERGARQVAVAVDAFFASALRDMNLNSTDLSGVVASAIQAWREDDERHDARFILNHGRAIGSPREDALLLAEMAEMALAAHGAGTSLYDTGFIESRFAAAGLEAPSDLPDLHRAGRGLTLGLSSYYLASAIELADRHDLGRGLRGLPVERWRTHHARLLRQLGLDAAPVSIGSPVSSMPAGAAAPPVQVTQTGPAPVPMPEETPIGPLFAEVIAESLERRIATRELAKSALQDAQSSILLIVAEI